MPKELQDLLSTIGAISSLLALIVSIGAAAVATYFGPYLKQKAEARAKAEDFDHFLEDLEQQTRATERIKAEETLGASLRLEARKSALDADSADRTESLKAQLARNIEQMKGEAQAEISHLAQVFTPRLEAYRKLWELMLPVRFAKNAPLSSDVRRELSDAMTDWYYMAGGGLFLSQAATDTWLAARAALLQPEVSDSDVRSKFSALRAQLKDDIGVYGQALKRQAIQSPGDPPVCHDA